MLRPAHDLHIVNVRGAAGRACVPQTGRRGALEVPTDAGHPRAHGAVLGIGRRAILPTREAIGASDPRARRGRRACKAGARRAVRRRSLALGRLRKLWGRGRQAEAR